MNEIYCTKLQLPPELLTRWLPPPDPLLTVLCPQMSLLNHPPPRTKFLGTPLVLAMVISCQSLDGAHVTKCRRNHYTYWFLFEMSCFECQPSLRYFLSRGASTSFSVLWSPLTGLRDHTHWTHHNL